MLKRFLISNFKVLVALLLIVSLIQPLALPNDASAQDHNIQYVGPVSYGNQYGTNTVGYFKIDGKDAFCINHWASTPPSNTPYSAYAAYNDTRIQRALYYGWNGPKNIFSNFSQGYVVTSLVLSRLNGYDGGGHTLPGYTTLWDIANSNDYIPNANFDFSTHNPAVHFNSYEQYTDQITMIGDSHNTIKISLPKGVSMFNDSIGKPSTYVSGGQRFHLTASLTYTGTLNTGSIRSSIAPYQSYVMKFRGGYQPVAYAYNTDPPYEAGISAKFIARTENVVARYIDTYNNSVMWTESKGKALIGSTYSVTSSTSGFKADGSSAAHGIKNGATYKETGSNRATGKVGSQTVYVNFYYDRYWDNRVIYQNKYPAHQVFNDAVKQVKVNNGFTWTIPSNVINGSNTYDLYNNGSIQGTNYNYSGKQPDNNLSKTFLYILRRNAQVNYKDNRTGTVIHSPKDYTLHQGDNWNEHPISIMENGYNARYTGNEDNNYNVGVYDGTANGGLEGMIDTRNLNIDYYYDTPLMKIGVKDLQIYTAPKENGLPVKVALDKVYNYATSIADMSSKTINISLYQGSTRIATQQYAANKVPDNLTFTIPSSFTQSQSDGSHLPYTVKFEGYSTNDFDVLSTEASLTTSGYTSAKANLLFDVNSNTTHTDSHQYIVRTESSVVHPTEMDTYETYKYSATPLEKNKSGYGQTVHSIEGHDSFF